MRDEPPASNWNSTDLGNIRGHLLFPFDEIDCAGKGREHHELSEGQVSTFGDARSSSECLEAIAGKSKDKGPQDMNAVLSEGAQAMYQGVTGEVEVFVDIFQTLGRHGFDTDERALDIGQLHGLEEVGIFSGFHRDLCEEDHVRWKFCHASH